MQELNTYEIEQKLKERIEEELKGIEYFKLDIEIRGYDIYVYIIWSGLWRDSVEEECSELCKEVENNANEKELEYCVDSCINSTVEEQFLEYYYLPKLSVKFDSGIEVNSITEIEDDIYSINFITSIEIKGLDIIDANQIAKITRKTIEALFKITEIWA